MNLKPKQAIGILLDAGFDQQGAITMACIGWAESRLNPDARNVNNDEWHSVDRGWLQLNDHWHPEVTDECADDPACAAAAAYRISEQGTSFSAWATFVSGAYRGPEGLALIVMNQAYTIWTDEKLLIARKAQLDTDEATIATLQASADGLRTEVGRLNGKIMAAKADLS